jgi:hypothetical protein
MSPAQLKKLQELRLVFSQGKANHKQIQQLSALLAQINCYEDSAVLIEPEHRRFIAAPWFG